VQILPCDGTANYLAKFIPAEQCAELFGQLLDLLEWQQDRVVMFGKERVTKRSVIWYYDGIYRYSGVTKQGVPWSDPLLRIKGFVEDALEENFNSCLANLYHDGNEGMGWHSDDEPSIVRDSPIASVSFGASRKFSFRHRRTKEVVDIVLEPGSLLVMAGEVQRHWQHTLRVSKRVTEPRVNLTFRQMVR
jgi:alkylated DNA repair dioxygenase AlkB